MKHISAMQLGATLFIPATHKHLENIATGVKYDFVRSIVIDLEDGISVSLLQQGIANIEKLLHVTKPNNLLRFIRPTNPDILKQLCESENIKNIDGFVLPKFGLNSAKAYLEILSSTDFIFMPSIESYELFDAELLKKIRQILLPFKDRIPVVRFGLEDMFCQLKLRRECSTSVYEMTTPSLVIAQLLATFKPHGFDISAPVFRCFNDEEGFKSEVIRDLREGLVSKTVIHPKQVEWFHQVYKVDKSDLMDAKNLLASESAILAQHGNMAEAPTQSPWAKEILQRAELYGVN